MTKQELDYVFVPSRTPTVTYVERPTLEKSVDRALSLSGESLLVYGPSATGKTTLVKNRLERARIGDYVEVRPSSEFSEEVLYRQILAELMPLIDRTEEGPNGATMDLYSLRATLFERLSRRPMPILVDDARRSHVRVLADLAKEFNQRSGRIRDPKLTLIIVGIDVSVEDFLSARPAEVPRFVAVPVSRFLPTELHRLIEAGENALNIRLDEDLKDSIVQFSAGLPHVCHHICYNICHAAGVIMTSDQSISINGSHFLPAVEEYANTMMPVFAPRFERVSKLSASRRVHATDVLSALFEAQDIAKDDGAIEVNTIVAHLRQLYPGLVTAEIKEIVDTLHSPDGGEILTWTDEQRVTFSEPVVRYLYRMRREGQSTMDQTTLREMGKAILRALEPGN